MASSVRAVSPRDPQEHHRTATALELFTDLCYVVAVAQAATGLHHAIAEDHVGHGLAAFALSIFAIWWAWLNFAWFNSAYDPDDVVHRLLTLLQILGSLVLAAGIPRFFEDDYGLGISGYVIMRIGLVAMWLRASRGDPDRRSTALRYAGGLVVVQLLWIAFLFVPEAVLVPLLLVLVVAEFGVPVLAEHAAYTPWHPHHIAERYGLFFIIVLGETVLSTTVAIQAALDGDDPARSLGFVVGGALLVVFSLWWLYFSRDAAEVIHSNTEGYVWGFGHYFVFASGAALGAGLAARVDFYQDSAEVGSVLSAVFVTGPVAVFLLAVWLVHIRLHDPSARTWGPLLACVGALVVATFLPYAELWAGLALAALLVVELGGVRRAVVA